MNIASIYKKGFRPHANTIPTTAFSLSPADILKYAKTPMLKVAPETSVQKTVEQMAKYGVGAAIIVSDCKVRGIFTANDLVIRVIAAKRSLLQTTMADVMTSPVTVIVQQASPEESEVVMARESATYLPIVNAEGELIGVLSALDLLHKHVAGLDRENKSLAAYVVADGAGG